MSGTKDREIFAAAASLFKEKGFHATSMQDIADAVGMQKGSLYYHIAGKDDLLFRISFAAISAVTERLEVVATAPLTPTEKFRGAVTNHVETLCDMLDLMSVFLKESNTLTADQQAQIHAYAQRYEDLLESILNEGVEAGDFRPMDVRTMRAAILGMLNWMHQWYRPSGRLTPAEIANIFVDFALRGVASSAHASAAPTAADDADQGRSQPPGTPD